jgi:hypothetical protein
MAWTPPSDAVEAKKQTATTGGWNPPGDALEVRASKQKTKNVGLPAGEDLAALITPAEDQPKPERKVYTGSVFDTQPFDPKFDPEEAARLSRRDYAEREAQQPRRTQSMRATPQEQIERSAGRAVADTAIGLLQGAVAFPKGIAANINAGDNPIAKFYEEAIQAGERSKSPFLRSQKAGREALLKNVLENQGELAQTRAAFNSMFSPSGADIVSQGVGSILPTVGMSLFGLGAQSLRATNALSVAGEAAQNTARELSQMSPQEWSKSDAYQELRGAGLSHADAVRMLAPLFAVPSQLVGGGAGFVSGGTGLEKSLAGKGITGGARERAARAGSELLGEQLETLAPSLAGNITQRLIDEKTSLTENLGREAVETLFGSTPGAALAATGKSAETPKQLNTRGLAERMARERGFLTPETRAERPSREAPLPTQERVEPTFDPEKLAAEPTRERVPQKIKELGDLDDLITQLRQPEAEPILAEPEVGGDLVQQREQERAEVFAPEGEAKAPGRFSYMDEAAKYDTPEMRLKQAEALDGDDVTSLIFGETESYGRAALKKKSLTSGYSEKMDNRNDAADAATVAFGTGDYTIFTPYEKLFPKTAAKLKAALIPKQEAPTPSYEQPEVEAPADLGEPFSLAEEMEGVRAPLTSDIEGEIERLTKDQQEALAQRKNLEKRTAGTSLFQTLRGTLKDNELSELAGRARMVGKNQFLNLKAPRDKVGSSMENMVNSGKLDQFLPYNMRPGQPDYDNGESAEYIREKLRNNQFYTYETELAIRQLDQDIESIERQIEELLSDDDINKELQYAANEQREIDQATQEPAAPVADRAAEQREREASDDELDKREAQLDREAELNQREARLLEERKRLEEERLKLESPTKEDVKQQEERKAKAAETDEREQIRKESEAGAGQFELTREEGRQDTTGGLFDQPVAEPAPVEISTEEERKKAIDQLKKSLSTQIPPFKARGGNNRVSILKPTPLSRMLLDEVLKLANTALDLGLPPAVLGDVKAAGGTRSDTIAMMTNNGWLMIGKQWSTTSQPEKLLGIIHEIGHAVDYSGGLISDKPKWDKAHTELKEWYRVSADKFRHPFAYPFASQYKGKVRPKQESFAQAFGYYFTSPVDLQKNAPEAYSQIQAIIERIQDESQAARAAGATATSTAGIKIQPTRTAQGAAAQPAAGAKRAGVGTAPRLEDRGAGEVKVDGVNRPTTNSDGQPIAGSEEATRNFWKWVASEGVFSDDQGRPIVLYHGTNQDVQAFDPELTGGLINLTTRPSTAEKYAITSGGGGRARSAGFIYVDPVTGESFEPNTIEGLDIKDFKGSNGTILTTRQVQNKLESGEFDVAGSGANILPLYAKGKILDLQTPEGLSVLASLPEPKGNSRSAAAALEVIRNAKKGDFFWETTKYEGSLRHWEKVLNPMLKDRGYYGIKFSDDNYNDPYTIAVFGRRQVKSATGNVGTYKAGTADINAMQPSTAKPSPVTFYEDIPNESWLQGKIDYAIRSPRNQFGVPKMSSVTGSFKNPVMVPTRWLTDAKGQRGEEKNVRQKDLDAIRKIIRETGKFPLNEDGTEYVPYIEIGYDGKPWVSEGNHRIMAAIAEGLEYIPVELRYFDGGQRRAGKWNPENVKEITERLNATSPEAQDINMMQGNPPTKEKLKQLGDTWLLGRDKAGNIGFGPGAKAYSAVANIANKVLDKIAMKPVSPELGRAMRNMKARVELVQNKIGEVAAEMNKLSKDEREMISDIIEGELKADVHPPQHILNLAASIQSLMSRQSEELVELGMLSKEAANRWENKYLPRFYETKLRDEVNAWAKATRDLFKKQPMMRGIKGSQLRARGIFEVIDADDLQTYIDLGWEQRDPEFNPKTSEATIVWRDYNRAERENMGEIRDAMFRFVMGYNASQRDIALGRLYKDLAENYASPFPLEGYVKVPETKAEGTQTPRYGKLEGLYVPKEVMDHLSANDEAMASGILKLYRAGLSKWKEGKTVLNPVSHANNVISNVTMSHFAGVSYWDAHKYAGAVKDFVTNSDMIKEAKEIGVFGGSFNNSELVKSMPPELKAMANMTESRLANFGERIWDTLAFTIETKGKKYGVRPVMQWAYEGEDMFFRYLIYRDARQRGMDPEDARDYSQEYIFTYDDLPKGARALRDYGMPFFSYTYKVVPVLARTALVYPWRYAAPATIAYTANALMYAIAANMGGNDDDWWTTTLYKYLTDEEFRKRAKAIEAEERKLLPEWMKGQSAILSTPKAIRMGMDETTNLPMFLDISRIFPGGDLLDANNNTGGVALLQPLTPSNPVITTLVAMLANKDMFLGKDVVKKTDTDEEKAQKRAAWLWKQATPAIAVGNYHFDRAMSTIASMTQKPITIDAGPMGVVSYTGVGKDGLPVQPDLAMLQTMGIKIRPYDLELSRNISESAKKQAIREIDLEITRINRQEGKKVISAEAAQIEREKLLKKKGFIAQGLTPSGEEKK